MIKYILSVPVLFSSALQPVNILKCALLCANARTLRHARVCMCLCVCKRKREVETNTKNRDTHTHTERQRDREETEKGAGGEDESGHA